MATTKIALWICASFVLLLAPSVSAENWRNLVQPIGALLVVEPAGTVNGRLGGIPPFDVATDVTTIQTSTQQYFVRFYNPNATANASNAIGSWVMRSATVRGLTATQVRDIFALPSQPTMMTMVLVPTNSRMYTGIAGPIAGWGVGGAQQSKLVGPPFVPAGNFINQQAMGDCVLCYRVLAMEGNANHVATYLDGHIPAAYSDLENVYTNLDLLYFGPTVMQLRQALSQISPLRYDNLASDALRTNVMFNDMTDQRVSNLMYDGVAIELPSEQGEQKLDSAWVRLAGSSQRAGDSGFNAHTSAIFAGIDGQISADTRIGFSAGFIHSDLDWTGGLGGVKTDYAKLGAYAVQLYGNGFVQGGFNAGISQGAANRRITFSTLDRSATSSLDAWEGNARIRVGYRYSFEGVKVVPAASLDYFYQNRDGFSEKGADSLNLRVQSTTNRTLRSHAGLTASWDSILRNAMVLTPQFQLGWAHVRPLGERAITASIEGQSDRFTVYGDTKTTDALTTGVGINLISGKNLLLFLRYDLEYRRDLTNQGLSAGLNYHF
ncbi:MAG: autotransporter outer membrane beta-barrel domain-containing protein [Gallionella sp.]|jgi:outer membrane autotransporter protein